MNTAELTGLLDRHRVVEARLNATGASIPCMLCGERNRRSRTRIVLHADRLPSVYQGCDCTKAATLAAWNLPLDKFDLSEPVPRVFPMEAAPRTPFKVPRSPHRETTLTLCKLVRESEGEHPKLFQSGDGLLQITETETGNVIAKALNAPAVREFVDRRVECFVESKKGDKTKVLPPWELITSFMNIPESAPPLRRILRAPSHTTAGTLRTRPGYDPADGDYLHLDFTPLDVQQIPTAEDVARAKALLLEPLSDFPFATDSDRANAVGVMVLPLARELIDGPTPLQLASAATAGSGKTLLLTICMIPALGRNLLPSAALPDNGEELRKLLTSLHMERQQAILFDNLTGFQKSPVLAKSLTDREHCDRKLGSNQSVILPVRMLYLATANNPSMSDELARRTVVIRLLPDCERPEDRTGFSHPDLIGWTLDHRAELVWGIHVLIQNWIAQGRPAPSPLTPALGSYEAYRAVIGGILTAAGIEGFLMNRSALRAQVDPESARWQEFVSAWAAQHQSSFVAVTDLLPLARTHDLHLHGSDESALKTSLGSKLGQRLERVFAGFRIERDGRKWRVAEVSPERPPW